MNRVIKFRGWNGSNMLFYDSWFTLQGQTVLCFEQGKDHSYVDASDVDYPDRVIPLQFTGLFDKEGSEIYEGDVLKAINGNLFEVIWENELSAFRLRNKWIEDVVEQNRFPVRAGIFDTHKLEVVGNIYENPELLTK